MLLPAPWMCFRTLRPRRGPVRTLLKDERDGQFAWLTGGPAALWEALEQGITPSRLHDRATALGLGEGMADRIQHWTQAGLLQKLIHRARRLEVEDPLIEAPVILASQKMTSPEPRKASMGEGPGVAAIGDTTTEDSARAWLAAHGYSFEADWPIGQDPSSARQAMDRLDFLRESGVFQIRIVGASVPPAPEIERIRLAAKAQGFSVVND